jgi:hypothetical protein
MSSRKRSTSCSCSCSKRAADLASILWTVFREVCCPGGTHRALSRRDRMIVARQFIAWNMPKKSEPSRRDGVSRAARHIHLPWSKNVLSTESYRALRDGFFAWHTPGNKLPGYDHSVPSGTKTLNTCPQIRRQISSPFRARELRTANCELRTANCEPRTANPYKNTQKLFR